MMDIPLLIHECRRRGVTFKTRGGSLRIRIAPGEVDDGFQALISAHRAEIVAHFAARLTGFSPHDPSFSPLSPAISPCGLNVNSSATSDSISFSPLSPLEKGERSRVWGNTNDGSEGQEGRRDFFRVYSNSPLRDRGLSGLNHRNPLPDNDVRCSPDAENSGLTGGLSGLNGGLNPSQEGCAALRPPVSPTWDELSGLRWGSALDDDVSSIDIPKDWRWTAAGLPHERWVRWRETSAAMLDGLDDEPTAEEIQGADHAAFDLLRTDGGIAPGTHGRELTTYEPLSVIESPQHIRG